MLMIIYLGLMSRNLNSIGNKDGSSSFLNVDNIGEINHKLKKESDLSMMMMITHTPDDVLHW